MGQPTLAAKLLGTCPRSMSRPHRQTQLRGPPAGQRGSPLQQQPAPVLTGEEPLLPAPPADGAEDMSVSCMAESNLERWKTSTESWGSRTSRTESAGRAPDEPSAAAPGGQ